VTNPNVPSLATPVVGNPISQSYLKAQVYDPLNFLLNKPVMSVGLSSDQTVTSTSSTYVPVQLNSTIDDNWGAWTTGTSWIWTAPCSGVFSVAASVTWAASTTGARAIKAQKNGLDIPYSTSWADPGTSQFLPNVLPDVPFRCTVGDTVQLVAFQNSGASLAIKGGLSFMTIEFEHF
jgi:hypothetical protein